MSAWRVARLALCFVMVLLALPPSDVPAYVIQRQVSLSLPTDGEAVLGPTRCSRHIQESCSARVLDSLLGQVNTPHRPSQLILFPTLD